jgi:outer membrane protein assembly factor BamB
VSADRSLLILGVTGEVHAVDRKTGEPRWKNGLAGGGLGEVVIDVHDELVVVAAGPLLAGLDYLTGSERWRAEISLLGHATVLIDDGCVICSKGREVKCFDLNGQLQWTQPLGLLGPSVTALGFPGNVARAHRPK